MAETEVAMIFGTTVGVFVFLAAILFGAVGDPRVPDNRHMREILLGLRFELDLYVNLRPCLLFDKRLTPLRDRSEADALEAEIAAARARMTCPTCGLTRAPGEACPRCDA